MVAFAVQDATSKYLAAEYPPQFFIMIRFWIFAVFVAVLAARRPGGLAAAVRTRMPLLQVFRGVLLATHDVSDEELVSSQAQMNSGSLTWNEFVHGHNLRLHCDRLRYFSHWITPDALPKRYTTRFFIAELPTGQLAHHDEHELIDSKWITATNALRAGKNGLMTLHFPTRKTLESLAEHHSVAALLSWASECEACGVTPTQPANPGELP